MPLSVQHNLGVTKKRTSNPMPTHSILEMAPNPYQFGGLSHIVVFVAIVNCVSYREKIRIILDIIKDFIGRLIN